MNQTLCTRTDPADSRCRFCCTLVRSLASVLTALLLVLPQVSDAAGKGQIAALPAIPLVRIDGTAQPIAQWLGKPAVVNIWATWCPPCRTEMPSLQQLAGILEPAGIRVMALSVDTDQNLVREFVLKYGIRLPVGIATSPSQAMAALGAFALPLTLYVGADGRILGQHLGQRDWADDGAIREIKQTLLGAEPPKH